MQNQARSAHQPPAMPAWPLVAYGLALFVPVLALLITNMMLPILAPTILQFFFAAVAISAWYGGLWPGILAALNSALLLTLFLIPPPLNFAADANDLIRLSIFILVCMLISALAETRQRAIRTARQQSEWLRVTLTSIGDAVIVTDQNQVVSFLNPVAEALTGWSQTAATNRHINEVFPIINATTRQPARNPIDAVLRENRVVGLMNHTLLLTRDGLEVPIDDSAAPIRDTRGQVVGVVLVFRDVTIRKQTEEALRRSEARFRLLAENARDMIYRYRFAPTLACEYMSPAATAIMGYTPEEYYADPELAARIVHPADRPIFDQVAADPARFNEPLAMRWVRKDGALVWTEQRNVPIYGADGRIVAMEGIARDITDRKRIEEALRESEARFRTMADTAPVLVWMADITGQCTFFNRTWLEFTGRPVEEELGDGWVAAVHRADRESCLHTYQTAFAQRQEFRMEYRLRRADGQYRWLLDNGVPRFTAEQTFAGYIGSCIDITERKRAEERIRFLAEAGVVLAASLNYEETLRNVARLSVPAIADWCAIDMLNPAGDLELLALSHIDPAKVQWAHALRQRYPVAMDAPMGAPHVIRTGQAEIYPEISDDLLQAVSQDAEQLEILRAVGYRSVMVVPLRNVTEVIGAISFVATESERRFNRDDLALAEEVARRASAAIEQAELYREVQQALQARDQFLSIASHELKTPLTTLLGYAQLLKRRSEQLDSRQIDDRSRRAVQIIAEQALRLNRLISSMLDLSRIETGQLDIERAPVDIGQLARHVVEEAQLTLDRHRLNLHINDEPLVVVGDALRLEQVFQNLIHNAIKYSPDGGVIQVIVKRRDTHACLIVSDEGIGIPGEALPQLFQRFYRAANVDARQISGMGVGLYVVREIIARHGGAISVESAEQRGSTFTVTLPLAADPIEPDDSSA